jgi:hypothetical protein
VLGEQTSGAQTVVIAGAIQVTLPAGSFVIRVSGDAAPICSVDGGYALVLSLADCHRVDIRPPNDPNQTLTGAIEASCVVLHPAPPGPTPVFAPNTSIRPPNTGNAGLAVRD